LLNISGDVNRFVFSLHFQLQLSFTITVSELSIVISMCQEN
jgi:hypothetical protein